MTRLYIWLSIIKNQYIEWFKKGDKVNDKKKPFEIGFIRILQFLLIPFLLILMIEIVDDLIQVVIIVSMMLFRHMSWNTGAQYSYAWANMFSIPIAALSIVATLCLPFVQHMIHANGGFHWVADDTLEHTCLDARQSWGKIKSGKTKVLVDKKKTWLSVARSLSVGFIFGGVLWIILIVCSNILTSCGINVAGSSNTTNVVTDSAQALAKHASMLTVIASLTTLLCSTVLSPIIEEMFFRGFLGQTLMQSRLFVHKNTHKRTIVGMIACCIMNGCWFGLAHMGTADPLPKMIFIGCWMVFFGAVLTYFATSWKHGGLLLTVSAHITYNAMTVLSVLFPALITVLPLHLIL